MKVQNSEQAVLFKENEDLYKRMNKSIEKKIANREDEIKKVEEIYGKRIEQSKEEGETKYLQNLDRNQQRILGESETFEKRIQSYNDQLKKAQDTVAREEENIKTTEKAKLDSVKLQMQENFEDQYATLRSNQDEIQSASSNSVKEIATKSKAEKIAMENNAQYEINALSSEFNQKAADGERDFRSKLERDVRLHNAEISGQKDELKKLAIMDAEKNKRLSEEKNRVNKDQLAFQDKHQQEMILQRNEDFKVRYEQIVKEHDTILKDLATHLDADVKKMVAKTSTEKKKIEERQDDPFYRVDKLNPRLTEGLKEISVSLPIAEYEKDNIHLSTQGRSIKVTLSRKYTDSLNGEDGSINRSTRSELFSKEFNTVDLLDARSITQNYSDGILTFKIKKA